MKQRVILALRYKIMLAFFVFLGASLLFVGLTYHRHVIIQQKLKLVEEADDLRNNVLEARRYEKNLLLYGRTENYQELIHFIDLAKKQLAHLLDALPSQPSLNLARKTSTIFNDYRQAAIKYFDAATNGGTAAAEQKNIHRDQLRDLGHILTGEIDNLVRLERRRVDELVAGQKVSLFYSFGAFLVVALFVVYYLYFLVFLPLSAIQTAASDIAAGQVHEIPAVSASPEIKSLIAVLNRMIQELDKKSEQLVQKEKMASLGTLTSGVAHELNNPLNNIYTSTQILVEELENADPGFQKKLLAGIEEQVEKARDIVKSLLEFSREHEFKLTKVNIMELIEKTLTLVQGELPAHVDIVTDIPFDFEVELDQRRISQALINLLLNSVQAMEHTEGSIRIGAYNRAHDRTFSIEVQDSGPGIREEDKSKIFDPFFSTKEDGSGTGLGLYVTYGIVQKHGGRIDVSSQPGQGTTFALILPVKQSK
jgi:two-component system NtrC family sensor kinase